ncbi:hypothetical protein FB45DRAFT_1029407 [Roridomyces roridus]|uniref:Uncharacterized protein n=1 Tax=Roridomyces roridus TaxID=1738132 RepID=A0AAD7BPJ8_9AGAR|nr:hypothetical protein FB45DRAFT_1029407 [Roridomyces roridus]
MEPENRLARIALRIGPALGLLDQVQNAFGTPFIGAISNTVKMLVDTVQAMKRNKQEFLGFLEHVHGVLYAIVDLHIHSETPGYLGPSTIDQVGEFMRTLHKIHTFITAQQQGTVFRQWLRQKEMKGLFKSCEIGIQNAVNVFKIDLNSEALNQLEMTERIAAKMHQELLEIIASLSESEATVSETTSKVILNCKNNAIGAYEPLCTDVFRRK